MLENEMRLLVDKLNKYAYEYYVLDNPTVSDKQYDELYDKLRQLELESGQVLFDSPTKRVGGEPISAFEKHTHIERLYSLDKATDIQTLQSFFNRVEKNLPYTPTYTVEYKFDGLTMCLTYQDGKFLRATTRGNGSVGEDVTAQVLTIKSFPLTIDYKGVVEVKGEAIIRLSVLNKYNEQSDEPLKNARNAVAGAVRNLDPKVTQKRKVEIYFYDVNYIDDNSITSQQQAIKFLKDNGFKVFDYLRVCVGFEQIKKAIDEIEVNRKNIDVLTDGVVIKTDDFAIRDKLGSTEKFPRWAIAYKFEPEETTTMLNDVVWQVGRTGKLTPLAILQPIELCGVTVRKATLNNYGDILRKKVKINSRVLIHRSNEVIPEILGTTEYFENSKPVEKPTVCPECSSILVDNGANIFCENKKCPQRVILSLTNFASKEAMNIDGFSQMTATTLFEKLNVTTFSQLYRLDGQRLIKLEGFQDKKVDNLLQSIEKSKNVSLENFIYALGIDGIGKKTAKDLAKKYKSIENLKNATVEDLLSMQEIGEVLADNLHNYFLDDDNVKEIDNLIECGINILYKDNTVGNAFAGQKVVLTGTLERYKRSQAQSIIESLGGEVVGSVSKLTTMVLAGSEAGSKLDKAINLGIKVINEQEFESLANLINK